MQSEQRAGEEQRDEFDDLVCIHRSAADWPAPINQISDKTESLYGVAWSRLTHFAPTGSPRGSMQQATM